MGQRNLRLQRFLKEHPLCCFCGGTTPAATQDHLPPRSVFVGRQWPEGYVFPGCEACNAGSAERDSIFAMVTRFDPTSADTPESVAESERLIRAFKERHPQLAREMIPSATDVRRWMRQHELRKPDGVAYGEIPLVRVPKGMAEAVEAVSRKLILALHYKHTGRIVPADAEVSVYWWTNAQKLIGKFPSEAFNILKTTATLERGSISLQDQCSYKYEVLPDGTLGGYLIAFRQAIIVAGFVVIGRADRLLAHEESIKPEGS